MCDHEFDLLCTLAERAGEIVSNRELMARVWGKPVVGKLRFHINALNDVLSQDGREVLYIRKVVRHGYIFAAPVCRGVADDGEGSDPLWDGHIIDATFPPV